MMTEKMVTELKRVVLGQLSLRLVKSADVNFAEEEKRGSLSGL